MMVVQESGHKCGECNEFTKKFIICNSCRRRICLRCAIDNDACIECYICKKAGIEVENYFKEKYAAH